MSHTVPFFIPIPSSAPAGSVTFSDLYGDRLDQELGSADRTKLFTTAKRKAAINFGQREFVKQTECLPRQATIALTSGVGEIDLDAELDDGTWLTAQGVELQIVPLTGSTRYVGGDDLPIRTIGWLNRNNPGWREASAGTPTDQYLRDDGGSVYLGLTPAPLIPTGDVWSVIVPYLALPEDMTGDTAVPFAVDGDAKRMLWPWHQALVHYAAAQLELLRKEAQRSDLQMKKFAGYVADYLQRHRTKGGTQVSFTRDYRGDARRSSRGVDPRRDF